MSRYASVQDDKRALAAGNRDKPVKIEKLAAGDPTDDSGFPDPNDDAHWSTLVSVEYMNRETLGGMERISAMQTSAPVDTVWTMGYREDMDPDKLDVAKLRRLVYENRKYDIVSGSVIGRNDGIQLVTLSRIG